MTGSISAGGAQRRGTRFQFLRPVYIRPANGRGELRRLFASNVSEGGMFIRTPKPVDPETELEILLETHGRAVPFAKAVVAHSLPLADANAMGRLPGFGVRFTDVKSRGRKLLPQLLSHAAPRALGREVDALGRTLIANAALSDTIKSTPIEGPMPAKRSRRWALGALAIGALLGLGALGTRAPSALHAAAIVHSR